MTIPIHSLLIIPIQIFRVYQYYSHLNTIELTKFLSYNHMLCRLILNYLIYLYTNGVYLEFH
jgi:hypothetical protein